MSTTAALDQTTWDVFLDATGQLALATAPYQIAQDVACMTRTFRGECWYNKSIGVPYLQSILGQFPNNSIVKTLITTEAARVPGCNNPVMFITSLVDRNLVGQIQFNVPNQTTQVVPVVVTFNGS